MIPNISIVIATAVLLATTSVLLNIPDQVLAQITPSPSTPEASSNNARKTPNLQNQNYENDWGVF